MADHPRFTPDSFSSLPRRALLDFLARTVRPVLPLFGPSWPGAPDAHARAPGEAVDLAEAVAAGRVPPLTARRRANQALKDAGRASADANAVAAKAAELVAEAAFHVVDAVFDCYPPSMAGNAAEGVQAACRAVRVARGDEAARRFAEAAWAELAGLRAAAAS